MKMDCFVHITPKVYTSPVDLHNLFPSKRSSCSDVGIARAIVECTRVYDPHSVLHTDFFKVEHIKEKELKQ